MVGIATARRSSALLALALLALVAPACTEQPPPPTAVANPVAGPAARTNLLAGGLEVDWDAPAGYAGDYDIEVKAQDGEWRPLTTTAATSAVLESPANRTRHSFRVRAAATDTLLAGSWGPEVDGLFVDLVLPVVRLDTGGAPVLDKENYVPGSIAIEPNGSAYAAYAGTMGVRGRGNSTWTYPKKPYRVKLSTASEIMGMESERDWVLLANAIEKSQLRTVVGMEASAATDLPFTHDLRHVEVVLNGRYDGVYQLTQHPEVGPHRVDITEMDEDDNSGVALTGGYRLEIDFRLEQEQEPGFRTGANVPIVVKDPDPMTPAQQTYIRDRVQAFENALLGANFAHPLVGYRAYVDVDSFVDHYLVQELTRNQDAFHGSTFITKERGEERFRFGPVWDFDRSVGTDGGVPRPAEGWWVRTVGAWAPRFFADPAMRAEVAQRWSELEPAFRAIVASLPARGAALAPAIANDAARWNYTLSTMDRPQFLVDWLTTRMDWMSAQFAAGG